jgi:Uma2 family endonuclease
MLLELKRFSIPPGQRILLHDVSWQELELILDELGEHRAARIAYDNGNLEIMTPLPEHEDDKEITSDLVKALLEELEIEFRCLGSTTFKNASMSQGIEPDQCFYIENESRIRGKKRLDLSVDPPPDLALEIDLTSRTHPSIYEKLKVPELWRFDQGTLQINILRGDKYAIAPESQIFPGLNLMEAIPQHLKQSKTEGRNTTLKAFRKWLRAQNISA